jgi:hypothetical protein
VGSLHLAPGRVAPFPLPDVHAALVVPDAVVAVEPWLRAWIRERLPRVRGADRAGRAGGAWA